MTLNRSWFFLSFWIFSITIGLSTASANVVSSGSQNFNTTPTGIDFVTVHSSETLEPGILHFGLFFNYSKNSLPYFDVPGINSSQFSSSLIGMDVNFGFGLLPNWDLGLSFPAVIQQSIQSNGVAYGSYSKLGRTEIRPTTKYRLMGDSSRGIALVGSVNFDSLRDDPFKGRDSGPGYNIEVAADTTLGRWAVALNLGHRWTQPGSRIPNAPIVPISNLWIASMAGSYLLPKIDTKFILEIFGSRPVDSTGGKKEREATSFEGLVGAKHDFTTGFAGHAGFGTSLASGINSPDWRVYVGLNFDMGPVYHIRKQDEKPLLREETQTENKKTFTSNQILFEFDSDKMKDSSLVAIDQFAEQLKLSSRYKRIVIEGHTDSVGKSEYNLNLSQKRAAAVRRYLIQKHHVPEKLIESNGYGAERPIADNGNFQGRQENRRVEFKVTF